jgi:hypothetical protein
MPFDSRSKAAGSSGALLAGLVLASLGPGCATLPDGRNVIDLGLGGGPDGYGLGLGLFSYQPGEWSGFGAASLPGLSNPSGPDYPAGTATFFGDRKIGESRSGVGFAGGWTYSLERTFERPMLGFFAGPALTLFTDWDEFDDPTGILEQGEGSYAEEAGDFTQLGLAAGFHLVFDQWALGAGYDSSAGLWTIRVGNSALGRR